MNGIRENREERRRRRREEGVGGKGEGGKRKWVFAPAIYKSFRRHVLPNLPNVGLLSSTN